MLTKLKSQFSTTTANGSILRNMMILASGTAGAQVIAFAAMPIITRIYSPSDFGVLAIFVAILSLLVPFATFRYSVAIPLPRRSQTAVSVLALSVLLSFAVAIFMTIVLFFSADYIFVLFSVSVLSQYWWLLPIALLGAGVYETLVSWSTREKQFKIIAKTKMTQSIASSIVVAYCKISKATREIGVFARIGIDDFPAFIVTERPSIFIPDETPIIPAQATNIYE